MSRLKHAPKLAAACVALIGGFEGLRLTAYRDSVGIPTACYGETRGIRMGMTFTKAQCDEMFRKALDEFASKMEPCIKRKPDEIEPDVYQAFLSLAYNIGVGGFCKSSVVRTYNAGDTREACDAVRKFNRAGGRVLLGLDRRRRKEQALCLKAA